MKKVHSHKSRPNRRAPVLETSALDQSSGPELEREMGYKLGCGFGCVPVGGIRVPDQVPSSRPSSGPELRSGVQEPLRLRRDLWLTLG